MKCLFIYNPKSGRGKILKHLDYVVRELKKLYKNVDVYESKSSDDFIQNVRYASDKYDVIIFSGGDGTFNNVASGISRCEIRPILGYIPAGTACDIARNLKIPRNIKKALRVIKNGYTIKHDVGMINDDYFMYVIGIGACTGTSYTTKSTSKKFLGRLAYLKDGIDEFLHSPVNDVRIIIGNEVIEKRVPLLLILNTMSVGGIPFNRYCHLNDGLFDIVLINDGTNKGRFNILNYFLSGIFGVKNKKSAITYSASEFKVEVKENLNWCVDGEKGPVGNIIIKNLHEHLTIYAPKVKMKSKK